MKITITVEGAEAGVPAHVIARGLANSAQYHADRLDSIIITSDPIGSVTASIIGKGRPSSNEDDEEHPF